MKKLLFLFPILFLCGINDPEFDNTGYFPLRKGNTWAYLPMEEPPPCLPESIEFKIIRMKEINDNDYYVLDDFTNLINAENRLPSFSKTYLRMSKDNKIYQYDEKSKKEYLRYDFNTIGYYLKINGYRYSLESKNIEVTLQGGEVENCFEFFINGGSEGLKVCEYLANNIGISQISMRLNGWHQGNKCSYLLKLLKEATINGKKIVFF